MSKIVERTLDFIELFAKERRPLTLSDMARLLSIPVSSCHDVVRTLQSRGFLYELAPRSGFYPTLRLYNLVGDIVRSDPLLMRVKNVLEGVRDEIDETLAVSKAAGTRLTYVLVLEAAHPLRYTMRVGDELRSLHATSAGKCLLGTMPDSAVDKLKLVAMTPHTNMSKDDLRADIKRSVERGWYLNREESVVGVTTISARFEWLGTLYIVTMAGPSSRMEGKLELAGERLRTACAQLSMDP